MFGMILIAAAVAAVIIGALMAPVIGLAAVPALGYLYYRNSPQTKEREARERTEVLYRQACAVSPPDEKRYIDRFYEEFGDDEVVHAAITLYIMEGFDVPPKPPAICNTIDGARYRDQLITYINKAHERENADDFVEALIKILPRVEQGQARFQAKRALTNDEIEDFILRFFDNDRFFQKVRNQFNANLRDQNGVMPSAYKGENCAFAYFKETPLLALSERPEPIDLTNRTEHTYILGGTGHGKSSLIKYLVAGDMDEDCCVIVLDNQRQLISDLSQTDVAIDDLSLISPHNPLALNLFDFKGDNYELMLFVLSSIMEAPLTARQKVVFQFAIRLLVSIKGDLHTFHALLGGARYDLSGVDDTTRLFFETEFYTREYEAPRNEISWRVWTLLSNPVFERMFNAPDNKIDIRQEMRRKLVLIDADINLLQSYSGLFGRFFIAQIMQEAQRRYGGSAKPVYFYIDEAYFYLDENIERMLETARKANVGLIIAHQYLQQIASDRTRASILANTSTKFVGGPSDSDAKSLAGYLRTDAEVLRDQPKLNFSLYMKGRGTYTITTPVGYPIERVNWDLREVMSERYAPSADRAPPIALPEPDRPPRQGRVKQPPPEPVVIANEEITPSTKL